MASSAFYIRRADRSDALALRSMQERSVRILCRGHYDPDLIDAFLTHIGTMDTSLLDEGRYFVAVASDGIIASGGWSMAEPGYAASASGIGAPSHAGPLIRAVYVRPDAAGRGLGRRIMEMAETEAAAAGFHTITLTAMLSAVEFYRRLGFAELGPAEMRLPGELTFRGVHMCKGLTVPASRSRAA
jgi:GNAT superfamily N-acetyltransferase